MVLKPEQQEQQHQLRMLLTEAITTLCQKGLNYRSHFNVEGLLGITLDDDEVFLVNIQKTVTEQDSDESPAELSKDAFMKNNQPNPFVDSNNAPVSRAKQRKKRKRSTDSIERVAPSNVALNNNNIEKKNSNVPIEIKPVDAWEEGNKLNRNKDTFDDTASSPGELIVVREDLSDNEQSDYPFNNQDKQAQHSRAAQEEDQKNATAGGSAIYASSNGQMGAPRTSPFQGAWDDPGRSFAQQQQEQEPDDTACLKAAYAETSLGGRSGSPALTSTPAALTGASRRKRTLDSVVKNLHNSRKYLPPQRFTPSPRQQHHQHPHHHLQQPEDLSTPSPINITPQHLLGAADFVTAKNINNNNVTIDPNTGLEIQQPPPRKKGPFGKKRLTEMIDTSSNPLGNDSASDISMNSSLGSSDATCQICNKVLSTKASYKRHMNFHQGIYPHRCSVCGKGFAVKGDLRGHEATHTNEKEFPCTGCDRVFAYKKNLQMHMRKKHNILTPTDHWPKKEEVIDSAAANVSWPIREAIHAGGELSYGYVAKEAFA